MNNQNQQYETYENLSHSERVIRVIVSTAAIIIAMESSIAGSTMFAVISILGIALAMTGIIGWDPVRALSSKGDEHQTLPHRTDTNGHSI